MSGAFTLTYEWVMLTGTLPVAHQRCEAITDLMEHLRARRLVLTREPHASIRHGVPALLTLTCEVRDPSPAESQSLGH